MVVGRALRATGCASCRLSLLRSFTSLAGPSIRLQQPANFSRCTIRNRQLRYSSQISTHVEAFGASKHDETGRAVGEKDQEKELQDELGSTRRTFEEREQEKILNDELEFIEDGEEKEVSKIPWYLQVDSPARVRSPISERQRMPELPVHPPPVLEPLMQHVSIDLGLDDLKLLDLRKLDPPPALGANLLMLISTARSEKHLHVSADRLCRWLRSTYKLKPDADGLLGRNELKLKLKRKAKRAKLMGGSVDDSNDDGVRTGWVCVDIGVVEEAEGVSEATPARDFIGFGRRTEGVRIVVQMLTEEKREEINLERLWTGILERGTPKEIENGQEEVESGEATQQYLPVSTNRPSQGPSPSQTRNYHTTARRLSSTMEVHSETMTPLTFETITANPFESFDLQSIRAAIMVDLGSGNFEKVKSDVFQYSQSVPQLKDDGWRPFLLQILRTYLASVPSAQALEMLGTSDSDRTSTQFLKCFYETVSPIYISESEAETLIWLSCFAQELEHPGYEYFKLLDLFDRFRADGLKISLTSYRALLRAILSPPKHKENYHGASKFVCKAATTILQTMHDQGLDILEEDLLVELQELTMPDALENVAQHKLYTDPDETFDLPSIPMAPISARLYALIVQLDLPLFSDESRMRLMDLYANRQHWQQFCEIFRMAPRQNKPQSASMYAFMLFHVAHTKNQKACMTVLRVWSVDLQREEPAIELTGHVSEALKACLLVADPHVERDVENPEAIGEWINLWRRCQ